MRKINNNIESTETAPSQSRRHLLQSSVWAAPVVLSVSLPQHAQATIDTTTTIPCEMAIKVCYASPGIDDLTSGYLWKIDAATFVVVADPETEAQIADQLTIRDPNNGTWVVEGDSFCTYLPEGTDVSMYGLLSKVYCGFDGCKPLNPTDQSEPVITEECAP